MNPAAKRRRRPRPRTALNWRRSRVRCYCGAHMRLQDGRYSRFYGCTRYPKCDGTVGAHPDGLPMGFPLPPEQRRWRERAHAWFDRLWKRPGPCEGGHMSRPAAYRWMQREMGLQEHQAHIAEMGPPECRELIWRVQRELELREEFRRALR